jgi:hypothetical protein
LHAARAVDEHIVIRDEASQFGTVSFHLRVIVVLDRFAQVRRNVSAEQGCGKQ